MITSRQLEYFQAVARELHFTRAAEALRIAQPALSQQIRKLERQLGLVLFERNNHRVALTPAGSALLEHAERILADLVAVEDEMLGWAGGVRGRIRLGAARGLMGRLTHALATFCGTYPRVEMELRELNTAEMIAELRSGGLDVATLASSPPGPEGRELDTRPLGGEPLVLVTGAESPLAGRDRLPIAELDGLDLVHYAAGSAVGEIIVAALAEAGAEPRARFESREYGTARALAAVGLAVAVMPRSAAEAPGPPVGVVGLDPEPVWTPCLAWSAVRRPAPALSAFIDFMAEHLQFSPAQPCIGDR
ncbi:LysR substrate-binding domain-containing protein [Actinoallomurus liliacearum]|uniref:LysR substrate-binding domain-containing protein n=1 Tax=Actinoallomurus liliacearum TaxID=1080073 RepID=A0ABP8TK37_9ACTN